MKARRGAIPAILLLSVMVIALLFWPTEPPLQREPSAGQLPDIAVPDHYRLQLNLFPEQTGFRGEVEIDLQLHAATRQLYLHGRDLTVHHVEVRRDSGATVFGRYQQLTALGLARIDFDERLPAGFLTLRLRYDGQLTDTSEGLSRVHIGDDWYLYSQLHPAEARRVFPGFDEPRYKATFDIDIVSRTTDTVIGNSLPAETLALPDELKLTRLARTPRLPTFLLNISVGPFDVVTGNTVPANEVRTRPLPLRAITPRGQGGRTRYALVHTGALLSAFEQYFAVPYPFDKLDLLAVPDTANRVLENAGAINFLDSLMLIDEHSSRDAKQDFIGHYAHALAHQWFGDLVTMPWWDDLWLSEGFAEWLGYEIASQVHPEQPLAHAMHQQIASAMLRDSLGLLPAIRQPLEHEQDVQSNYDPATYDKALALMRMYQHFLGATPFRDGLRTYFTRHAFSNAGAEELFQSFGDVVADPRIANSVDSFLNQPGLPLLTLSKSCHNNELQLTLEQQAFQPLGAPAEDRLWQLPVCLRSGGDKPALCRLLTERQAQWLPGWRCDQSVVANAGGAGYYRWQLAADDRQAMLTGMTTLTPAEALDVVANLTASLHSGSLSLSAYGDSLPALLQHPDPAVLQATLDSWQHLLEIVASPAVRDHWQRRLQPLLHDAARWHPTHAGLHQFRALVLRDPALRQQLLQQRADTLLALRQDRPLADTDAATAVAVALDEEPGLLAQALRRLEQEQDSNSRQLLVQALAWQQNAEQLPALQQLLLSPHLRLQERWLLLRTSLQHSAMAARQWQWLQQQADTVLPLLPAFRYNQLPTLAESLCAHDDWQNVQLFLQQRADKLAIRQSAIASTDRQVRHCLALRQAFAASLTADRIHPESP